MSPKPQWHPAYSVGHRGMDAQHQALFELCSRVSACAAGLLPDEKFHEALNDLADYSRLHIEYEERILKQCDFPVLADHHKEHEDFMLRMLGFVEAAMNGLEHRQELAEYVWSWWRNHVLVSDMQYKPWVLKHFHEAR